MRVKLKGIKKVTRRVADGSLRAYYYAWNGGPRIDGELGTPEFIRSYNEAVRNRYAADDDTVSGLIREFENSREFSALSRSTRKAYHAYLAMIGAKFGTMPIAALASLKCVAEFQSWRDSMAETPRKADYAWATLSKLFSHSRKRGRIGNNPCEKTGTRLYKAGRADRIWTQADIDAFNEAASIPLRRVLLLAIWTGQRQADLLSAQWSDYDGSAVRFRQSKTGSRVAVPVAGDLKRFLDAAAKPAGPILTNLDGEQYTSNGFRASWRKACKRAGIVGLTFHDLRGTAVTRLAMAGCTVPEIASITGHSLATVSQVLDKHYLGGRAELAQSAARKLSDRFDLGKRTGKQTKQKHSNGG